MDFKKLSEVTASKITDSVKQDRQVVIDSIKKRREALKRKAVLDAKKKNTKRISDSYAKFKITDSYKSLKKKIKDDLEDTETTEAAVEAALADITPEAPAEQVLAAVVEILGDTIDTLQEDKMDDIDDPDFIGE